MNLDNTKIQKLSCNSLYPIIWDIIFSFVTDDDNMKIVLIFIFKEIKYNIKFIKDNHINVLNILASLTNYTIFLEAINRKITSPSMEELYAHAILNSNPFSRLQILQYCFNKTNQLFSQNIVNKIILLEDFELLEWIKDKYIKNPTSKKFSDFSKNLVISAVTTKNLNLIMYMSKNKGHFDHEVLKHAAIVGNYNNFIFIHSKMKNLKINNFLIISALQGGNIDIVKYLLNINNTLLSNIDIIRYASESCSLELIKYLVEEKECPMNDDILKYAANKNKLDIIIWAHEEKQYPLNSYIIVNAAEHNNIDILNWCHNKNCPKPSTITLLGVAWIRNIASKGYINVIKWLLEKNYVINSYHNICYYATYSKNIDFIKWLLSKKFTFVKGMLKLALSLNHKFFCQLGRLRCPFDVEIYRDLIIQQKYEIIDILLKSNKCSEIYSYASELGNMKTLELALQHKCPLTTDICINAAKIGNLDIIKWFFEKIDKVLVNNIYNEEISKKIYDITIKNNHMHIMYYLVNIHYNCDEDIMKIYRNMFE